MSVKSDKNARADVNKTGGLDSIVGVTSNTILTVPVLEDTYVEGGISADTNFGSAEMMDFRGLSGEGSDASYAHRIPLIKFDISSLGELNRESIRSVTLTLECVMHEELEVATAIKVCACDPLAWSENEVTYNTRPELGECVATALLRRKSFVNFDVTECVKAHLERGDKLISFALEGDNAPEQPNPMLRLNFSAKERQGAEPAFLSVTCGDYGFSTDFDYEGENPWKLAVQNVSEWFARWEEIKKGGDSNAETVALRDTEHTVHVDAATWDLTDGDNTVYIPRPTRLVSTVENYTPDFSEGAKLDVYGGLMDESLKQEATGHFYTKKVGDRYWTFDPLGYPFYRAAVVTVNPGYSNEQKKTVLDKYGTVENWAQSTTDRFKELGFNSVGNWSDIAELIKTKAPLSQTQRWNIMNDYARKKRVSLPIPGTTVNSRNVMPVFDPEFLPSAMESVETATKEYVGAPEVYGWFSDNELPSELNSLDYSLGADPKDPKWIYTYTTAWTFMYMKTGKINVTLADITDELRFEYRAMIFDKYYNVAKLCREKYIPMHQYFGSRFTGGCFHDESIIRVAGYYCDVISINYYGAWSAEPTVIENIQKWAGKPFAVTEWYAKGMDVWEKDNRFTNKAGAGFTVRNQADRAKFYQNFTLSLLECKGCVGYDWFEYMDSDPDSYQNISNKGMHDRNGEEYTELTSAMQEVNTQKYNLVRFFDERNHK